MTRVRIGEGSDAAEYTWSAKSEACGPVAPTTRKASSTSSWTMSATVTSDRTEWRTASRNRLPMSSSSSGPASDAESPKIEPSSCSRCSSADFAPASAFARRCMTAAAIRLIPIHTMKDTTWIDARTSPESRRATRIPLSASWKV